MGRPASIEKKVRLTLEIGESVKTRLLDLQEVTRADSLTEVVRRAQAADDILLAQRRKDGTVVLLKENGDEQPLIVVD